MLSAYSGHKPLRHNHHHGTLLGLERRDAAKFAMLLSIPTIAGAGFLVGWELYQQGNIAEIIYAIDGITYSFIASIVAIYIIMWWLKINLSAVCHLQTVSRQLFIAGFLWIS